MELNTRTARFARGELPLLLIRPIHSGGAEITAEDIGKLLPQLGLDRSFNFQQYNSQKPKYSHKESYKPDQAKPFYPSKDPEYLKEQELLRQQYLKLQKQHQHQPQQQQQHHLQYQPQQQQQPHYQQQHYQQQQQPHTQQYEHQRKPNYPHGNSQKVTENRFYIPHQPENYPQQNQYPKEEVVVGKPGISYHENHHVPQKNDFYVPKEEHIASFEVKSKAEFTPHQQSDIKSYDYTPKIINTITADDASNNYDFSPEKYQYQKQQQKHSLLNQAPQIEYFIPKDQEQADVQVHTSASADERDYFHNLKTDEYFLPKFEPEYHTPNTPKYPQRQQQFKPTPQKTEYPTFDKNVQELIDKYAYEYLQNPQLKTDIQTHSYSKPDSYLNLKPEYEDESEEDEDSENKFNPEEYVREAQYEQTKQLTHDRPHALQLKVSEVRPVNEFSDDVTTRRVVKPRIQTEAPETNTPVPQIQTETEFSQNLFEPVENSKRFTTPRISSFKSRLATAAPSTHFQVKSSEPAIVISGPGCERQCNRNTASKVYAPVCGSDGKTYSNKGKVNCLQQCGDSGEFTLF